MAGRAVRVDVRMMIAAWPVDAPRGAVSAFCRQHGISRSRFYEIRALAARHGPLEAVAPLVGVSDLLCKCVTLILSRGGRF